jgi:ABC-2 type transport system ATP-binding protein
VITVRGLSKVYGRVRAVDDLGFDVTAGRVTGFLGPNGAGKSTTMRMVVGLDRPTAGTALVDGRSYRDLAAPLHHVGALLDAGAVHPGRTGRAHLRVAARTHAIPRRRVEEVIGLVGLEGAAGRRITGYSLGMRQRLGIAAALLGDPGVLLFDEPVNGLDVDGVRWIRALLRGLAAEGRTVLVSSHLMSEMQLVADRVVVIGRGRLIADTTVDDLLGGLGAQRVRVRSRRRDDLAAELELRGATVHRVGGGDDDELEVDGLRAEEVAGVAASAALPVHHLSQAEQSLEDAYLALTEDAVEHHGGGRDRALTPGGAR